MGKIIAHTYDIETIIYNSFYDKDNYIDYLTYKQINDFNKILDEETKILASKSFRNRLKYDYTFIYIDNEELQSFFDAVKDKFMMDENGVRCTQKVTDEELIRVNSRYDTNINIALLNARERFKEYLNGKIDTIKRL